MGTAVSEILPIFLGFLGNCGFFPPGLSQRHRAWEEKECPLLARRSTIFQVLPPAITSVFPSAIIFLHFWVLSLLIVKVLLVTPILTPKARPTMMSPTSGQHLVDVKKTLPVRDVGFFPLL